ncbi:hypothetical protein ACMFMF_007584 [Clarireedia jacksonii]
MATFGQFIHLRRPSLKSKARKLQQSPGCVGPELDPEPSKTPLDRGLKSMSFNCALHMFPLAITSAMVYLNLTFTYWWDGSDQSTWHNNLLNMLQFAAKAHELCIGASITAMVSHFAIFILCRRRGLPFRLLGADIQVGSLNLFFNKSFWSTRIRSEVAVFTSFLVFCSLLAALSGPSSAIAIRPRLDWWQVANFTWDYEYHSAVNPWPMSIFATPSHNSAINCTPVIDSTLDSLYCPASGVIELIGPFRALNPIVPGDAQNISFRDSTGLTLRMVRSTILSFDQAHAYSTSLSMVSQIVVAGLWMNLKGIVSPHPAISQPKYVLNPKSNVKQPLVQVKCNAYAKSMVDTASPAISPPLFPVITSLTSQHLPEPGLRGYPVPEYALNSQDHDGFSFTWVNLYGSNRSASIGLVFKVPYANHTSNSVFQDSVILPCTVDARWISTEMTYDPTTTDETFSSLGQYIATSNGSFVKETGMSLTEVINIDPGWARLVNPIITIPYITNFTGSNMTIIEEGLELFTLNDSNGTVSFNYLERLYSRVGSLRRPYTIMDTQNFFSLYMATAMTDGLARYNIPDLSGGPGALISGESVYKKSPASSPLETPERSRDNWHVWRFDVWRKGYSYGARDITTKLALAVLLTHAALVIGFMIYLWIRGWTTNSWTSIGELVALALRSRSTKQFEGTDAGISRRETWAQNVRIREVNQGNLELRFGYDGCEEDKGEKVGKVEVGREYGAGALEKPSAV